MSRAVSPVSGAGHLRFRSAQTCVRSGPRKDSRLTSVLRLFSLPSTVGPNPSVRRIVANRQTCHQYPNPLVEKLYTHLTMRYTP